MAAVLRRDPSLTIELEEGGYGEFTVLVEGKKVISAGPGAVIGLLPSIRAVQNAIEHARSEAEGKPE